MASKKATRKQSLLYVALLAACLIVGVLVGWSPVGVRVDHGAFDALSRIYSATKHISARTSATVVAIDEATIEAGHGMRRIRPILADVLSRVADAKPRAVALDVILHDQGDPAEDEQLAAALRRVPNLVLDCELVNEKWEDPAPLFKAAAFGIGHVHLPRDREDGVSRQIPLELIADHDRRWALALETYLAERGLKSPTQESPEDLRVGDMMIPAARSESRALWIRYVTSGIETVSALHFEPKQLRDQVVFVGITALSAAHDRLVNPHGQDVPGVTVHAHAYETLVGGRFLVLASESTRWLWNLLLCAAAGLVFAYLSGWRASAAGFLVLLAAHAAPVVYFANGIVFPYFGLISVAWLSTVGAASYQYLFVQRALTKSESEKSRYQQAIHWVAHEMRTPLTAIQGSSEIMSRYNLPEEKRHQLSEMINSESKRMARMIQTFLDIERLADGQMELKREPFNIADVASACFKRALPLAERKQISLVLDTSMDAGLVGDRELMEYALYNLLTNAIKYSPRDTEVQVFATQRGPELRLSVRDQGMGMDADEQKKIFSKFYRTKSAEKSGEVGTGIGLSIVEQIVTHHGGRIEVASEPGKGSCFTMVLKAEVAATPNAETADRGR